ncbi:MAG: MerR family transcriptional regulator [Planctomycetota bacterium]|jgi:DNA-binding transcriptional MerR regulator/methylmalonyl-CoA mutase cobalamin-binding subunit
MATSTTQYSIGDLAAATGIAPDTIRVWERRYGRPVPFRLPSGHRRYTEEDVRWLRRIAEALSHGHRAGKAVRATEQELDAMLAPETTRRAQRDDVKKTLDLVRAYDRTALVSALRHEWEHRDPPTFLIKTVAPLITALGRAWVDGELDVRHEHFVTEVLEDVLRTLRVSLTPAQEPIVLFTTLSGEQHGLGLQMLALLATHSNVGTRILGTETPQDEIVRASLETGAVAVAVSVSLSSGGIDTDRQIGALRGALPQDVQLVIGGKGARGVRRGPRGVTYLDGLEGAGEWLRSL